MKLVLKNMTRHMSFSGGQRQRVMPVPVMEPDFVIADEPISALVVYQCVHQVLTCQVQATYLLYRAWLVSCSFISDRIAVIYKGSCDGETEEFNIPVHPYTPSTSIYCMIPDPILEHKKVLKVYDLTNMTMRQIYGRIRQVACLG